MSDEKKLGWHENIIYFDGNHGRDGFIAAQSGEKCLGCGETRKCLIADQSEGEYNPATICLDCIERLFKANP